MFAYHPRMSLAHHDRLYWLKGEDTPIAIILLRFTSYMFGMAMIMVMTVSLVRIIGDLGASKGISFTALAAATRALLAAPCAAVLFTYALAQYNRKRLRRKSLPLPPEPSPDVARYERLALWLVILLLSITAVLWRAQPSPQLRLVPAISFTESSLSTVPADYAMSTISALMWLTLALASALSIALLTRILSRRAASVTQ